MCVLYDPEPARQMYILMLVSPKFWARKLIVFINMGPSLKSEEEIEDI